MENVYVIWDEDDGYHMNQVFADKSDAEFFLSVTYSESWRLLDKAQVKEVKVHRRGCER